MVISKKHKYLFIEVPRTGFTAIRKELIENYGGKPILHKHATFSEFKKKSDLDSEKYFITAGKRNPLDCTVSEYLKYKNDHNDVRNRFQGRVDNTGFNLLKFLRASYFLRRVQNAQKENVTFKDYYLNFFSNR